MNEERTPPQRERSASRGRFRVKELAKERGMTLDQLARISQLKYTTVQNIWRNRVSDPRYNTLKAIAEALGIAMEDLEWPEESSASQPSNESLRTSNLAKA